MDIRAEVINFFKEDGLLSKHFENYEYRESQEQMAVSIAESLESKSHIFIEAPTGVGKSFAYLVPAIYFAKKYKRKAIISTHTINLQEQILYKDIPLLQKILPVEFKANLIKGKSNYVCPRRLSRAFENAYSLFEDDEQIFLDKIYQWSKKTSDGTTSDINFPIIYNVWQNVCAERGVCSTKTCGTTDTNCFYQKAKMDLAESDVIITNHHLFFTLYDGIMDDEKPGYLYKDDFVIFDEAHTLESVAADHISPAFSREMLKYHLLRLYNDKTRKGFLIDKPSLHILPVVQNLIEINKDFFTSLRRELFHMVNGRFQKLSVRVYDKGIVKDNITKELGTLIESLRGLRQSCKDDWEENELNEYIIRFGEFKYIISDFLEQKKNAENSSEFVYWVEIASNKEDANVSLCSSPVDLSDWFRNYIFRPDHSTIFTSATLTVNNSFEYFVNRLGGENATTLKLPSSFDYMSQMKMYIVNDIPVPNKDSSMMYELMLRDNIEKFVKQTNGKALVLFTNTMLMRRVAESLRDVIESEGIELLVQGESGSRKHILETFRENIDSTLFGLDSFWLGVDVPGESLSNLIITKLPFQVPDHPVIKARMEFIELNGGNSFLDYSLPEAILKFRQGVGRLIRSNTDKGILVVLDSRIVTKPYGKYFLNSIDECDVEIVTSSDNVRSQEI